MTITTATQPLFNAATIIATMPRVTFNRKPLGAVAAFIITLVVYAGYRAGNSSSAAALDSTVGMNAKTEPPVLYKQDDLQQHHPIVPALPTPPPALAPEERTQQSQPLTYVLSRLVSACELPSVPISSLHECAVVSMLILFYADVRHSDDS